MKSIFPVVILVLLLSTGVCAQSLDERLDLARAAARLEVRLAEDPLLRPFQIEVDIRESTLILTGQVSSQDQRTRAQQIADNTGIAEHVINRIELDNSGTAAVVAVPTPTPVPAAVPPPSSQPDTTEAPAAPVAEPVYHTVRSGETLFAISRRYNVTVGDIQQMNNLGSTTIRPGQRLRIR